MVLKHPNPVLTLILKYREIAKQSGQLLKFPVLSRHHDPELAIFLQNVRSSVRTAASKPTAVPFQVMQNKTAIVTGANTGIGKETALLLARCGATVVIACRDATKASAAASELNAKLGSPNAVTPMSLDLSKLASVEAFAEKFQLAYPMGCHVLVNNAGAMINAREAVEFVAGQQIEKTMAVNHLGELQSEPHP